MYHVLSVRRRTKFIAVATAIALCLAWWQGDRAQALPSVAPESPDEIREVHGKPLQEITVGGRKMRAISGEVIVKVPESTKAKFGGRLKPSAIPGTYRLSVPENRPVQEAADEARRNGATTASPNLVVTTLAMPNDSLYASRQWNMGKVSAPAAWDRTTGGGAVIASVDTGVNRYHQDLSGKMWTNAAEIAGNSIDDDRNGFVDDSYGMDFVADRTVAGMPASDADGAMDDHGHGSMTASVLGAATNNGVGIAGMDWRSRIMPLKVMGSNGGGSLFDVAQAIRYAADNGSRVVNLSLGVADLSSDPTTDEAIEYASSKGVVVVGASGNNGGKVYYPARHPSVVSVGATDSNDLRASYSAGGAELSLVAPGTNIPCVYGIVGNDQYAVGTGTSLAAPHVAGAAALLMTQRPTITPKDIKSALIESADKVAGMGGQSRTDAYGAGRLNVARALGTSAASAPVLRSQWAGQAAVPPLNPGEQATLYVDYLNTGTQSWSSGGVNPMNLGTSRPLDRQSAFYTAASWLAPNRPAALTGKVELDGRLTPASTINPGEKARFSFRITAPQVFQTTTFREYVQPVVEGVRWMEDYGVFWDITVKGQGYGYRWAGQSGGGKLEPGQKSTLTLDLTNTGSATWNRDGTNPFRIGTSRPNDRASRFYTAGSWLAPHRIQLSGIVTDGQVVNRSSVAPGETARFSFEVTAPSVPGTYNEYFTPVVDGMSWLPDIGIYYPITVTAPTPAFDYAYVGQTGYPTIPQGGQATVSLRLKNTGSKAWTSDGSNPLRLGTSRPNDRPSAFYDQASWLAPHRIQLTKNVTNAGNTGSVTVAPGETGEFTFTFKASSTMATGVYREYVVPLVEGISWLPDLGIFWYVTVS